MSGRTRVSHGVPRVTGLRRPCLVEIYGPNLGRAVLLEGPATRLGRGAGCDVVLDLDNVSRQHCTIRLGSGGCVVQDAESTNGTFVNDGEVHGERSLRPGDF